MKIEHFHYPLEYHSTWNTSNLAWITLTAQLNVVLIRLAMLWQSVQHITVTVEGNSVTNNCAVPSLRQAPGLSCLQLGSNTGQARRRQGRGARRRAGAGTRALLCCVTLTRDKNLQTSTPSPCLSNAKIAKYSREQYQKERQFSYGSHTILDSNTKYNFLQKMKTLI